MRIDFLVIISLSFSCQSGENELNQPWQRHTIDDFSTGADGVRLADVNEDGLMDIATGWEEGGFTKVYQHPGHEQVRSSWPSVIVGRTPAVEDAVFADVDLDGNIDVVSSTEGKNRKLYVHWAPADRDDYLDSAVWKTESIPTADGLMQWMFAMPAQIDGKDGVDLVVGAKGKDAKVGWLQSPANSRDVSSWLWHPISDATWIMSIIMHDMDHDGDQDIVISDRKPGSTNNVRWLENPGSDLLNVTYWNNHFIGAQDKEVMFMDIADIDKDGLQDVIVCERADQTILIWKNLSRTGDYWQETIIPIPECTGLAKAVKVGDLDQDGIQDIVLSTNTMGDDEKEGIIYLSFTREDDFSAYSWHELCGREGYKFDRLELLDLDGDGDLDVLTCEENYGPDSEGLGVIWYENPRR